MILLANRRQSPELLHRRYPDAVLLDLTSRGPLPWVHFSPFYPHGEIPVPFSQGYESASVEGVWQGLKVFEHADVDKTCLTITTMSHLKRSTRRYGKVLGHRRGFTGTQLLSYVEARWLIYLPTYLWVLEHNLGDQLEELRERAKTTPLIFLDYDTNDDITDVRKPLSHAGLVKRYLENTWPHRDLE